MLTQYGVPKPPGQGAGVQYGGDYTKPAGFNQRLEHTLQVSNPVFTQPALVSDALPNLSRPAIVSFSSGTVLIAHLTNRELGVATPPLTPTRRACCASPVSPT